MRNGVGEHLFLLSYTSQVKFAAYFEVKGGIRIDSGKRQLGVARAKAIASLTADADLSVGAGVRNPDHGADLGVSAVAFDAQVQVHISATNAVGAGCANVSLGVETPERRRQTGGLMH